MVIWIQIKGAPEISNVDGSRWLATSEGIYYDLTSEKLIMAGGKVTGVCRIPVKSGYAYQVSIACQDRDYYLGRFYDRDEAIRVRLEAEDRIWGPVISKWREMEDKKR